jgi:hypothetical protein
MHISEQPETTTGQHGDNEQDDSTVVPAPVASVAHVGEAADWNPLLPRDSTWTPRARRATHRANGKH